MINHLSHLAGLRGRTAAAVAASLAATLPASALAHVSLSPAQAPAGAHQALRFQLGHGCDDAATTALRIEIPEGVDMARPQPKPGWRLRIDRQGERVVAVTWSGRLPADQFDDFGLLIKTPATPATLYFPAVQSCGPVQQQWIEQPEADPGERLSHPAPRLTVGAPAGGVAAPHTHGQ